MITIKNYLKALERCYILIAFKQASKKGETEAFTYANLGYAYEQKEMIDKAVSNWEKALQIDPTLKDVGEKLKLYKDKEA